jgi:murein DD-endopeptidase MepM/ murein hydrolase activator NlpD
LNNFYTVLVIPEKTKQVKKVVIPTIYVRVGMLVGSVALFFIAFMVYDYVNVMRQLSENKRLQTENRQLKQQIQTFTTKLQGVQDSLDRIQTYTAKLRIITNQAGENVDTLKKKVAPDIPGMPMDDHSDVPATKSIPSGRESSLSFPLRDLGLMPPVHARLLASLNDDQAMHVANRAIAEAESEHSADEKATLAKKRLSDLIREDEERESAELRSDFQKLQLAFDSVHQHAVAVELDVQALTTALYDQKDYLNSMPTLKPTNGWYTSGFGTRDSPFTGKPNMHEGLDIANHIGSPIVAPAAGIVTYAGPRAGYGSLVTIDHGYGIQTQFGHISKAYVKVGDRVKRGHKIAAVGNTGRSTGPHVHYEVRVNGIPINPQFYILED